MDAPVLGRTGKLKPGRHPLSAYRLYRREQLDELLRLAAGSPTEFVAPGCRQATRRKPVRQAR